MDERRLQKNVALHEELLEAREELDAQNASLLYVFKKSGRSSRVDVFADGRLFDPTPFLNLKPTLQHPIARLRLPTEQDFDDVDVYIRSKDHFSRNNDELRQRFSKLAARAGTLLPRKAELWLDPFVVSASKARDRWLAWLAITWFAGIKQRFQQSGDHPLEFHDDHDGGLYFGVIVDPFSRSGMALEFLRNPDVDRATPEPSEFAAQTPAAPMHASETLREQPEPHQKKGAKLRAAMALLGLHPEWTDKRIADEVGCDPSNLSKSPHWRLVRETIRRAGQAPVKQVRDARTGENQLTKG